MRKIVEKYVELPKSIRKPMWRFWHWLIRKMDVSGSTTFLNYGYSGENGEFDHLTLKGEHEYHRYAVQLYCHATRNQVFSDSNILEVGCGRGGGAAFLAETFKPASYIGLDLNSGTTAFCNKRYNVAGLGFITGDAQDLPFENEKFDGVVNVESARCYPDMVQFFKEVFRVLKKNGKFHFADMIKPADLETIESNLQDVGFKILDKKDIRTNVVSALLKDSANRKAEIDKNTPGFLREAFYEFAGVEHSNRFKIFKTGEMGYWSFTLAKI